MNEKDLLWQYLRGAISELETRGFNPEPSYKHPGGYAYGDLGLTKSAYKTVIKTYPQYKKYRWEDVLSSPEVYDLISRAYADWLLRNYLKNVPLERLLDEFQLIWYLGPGDYRLYKKGKTPKYGSAKVAEGRSKKLIEMGFVEPSKELREKFKTPSWVLF